MSAPNSNGIQALLEAEKAAQASVQEARAFRSQRLKASKTDAAQEIDAYRKKKEQEFNANAANFSTNESQSEKAGAEGARSDIAALQKSAEKARAEVVKFLVQKATTTTV